MGVTSTHTHTYTHVDMYRHGGVHRHTHRRKQARKHLKVIEADANLHKSLTHLAWSRSQRGQGVGGEGWGVLSRFKSHYRVRTYITPQTVRVVVVGGEGGGGVADRAHN